MVQACLKRVSEKPLYYGALKVGVVELGFGRNNDSFDRQIDWPVKGLTLQCALPCA